MTFTPPTSFPAKYRNGRGSVVTILGSAPATGMHPTLLIGHVENTVSANTYYMSGEIASRSDLSPDHRNLYKLKDLPKSVTRWVNVYPDGVIHEPVSSRKKADLMESAHDKRIGVLRMTWEGDDKMPVIVKEEL
jgi:hypothetical protein